MQRSWVLYSWTTAGQRNLCRSNRLFPTIELYIVHCCNGEVHMTAALEHEKESTKVRKGFVDDALFGRRRSRLCVSAFFSICSEMPIYRSFAEDYIGRITLQEMLPYSSICPYVTYSHGGMNQFPSKPFSNNSTAGECHGVVVTVGGSSRGFLMHSCYCILFRSDGTASLPPNMRDST